MLHFQNLLIWYINNWTQYLLPSYTFILLIDYKIFYRNILNILNYNKIKGVFVTIETIVLLLLNIYLIELLNDRIGCK